MKIRLLLLFLLVSGCQPTETPEPMSHYWKNWGDAQLNAWLQDSQNLASTTADYCAGTIDLGAARSQWQNVFTRWSTINAFPYKGISDLTLEFELYFWPDRRNRVEGQLSQRLSAGDIANPELLETRIAAEKGLAAVEWLLFTTDADHASRCLLLPGTAEDYANKVALVADYHLLNPVVHPDWLTTENAPQSNSISLNLLFSQITALSSRLTNSLDDQFRWLPKQAYGWRADSTLTSFSSSLGALLDHLDYLVERSELTDTTRQQLVDALEEGHRLVQVLETSQTSNQDAPAEELLAWIEKLEALLQNNISQDFNVLIGFNNFDGD